MAVAVVIGACTGLLIAAQTAVLAAHAARLPPLLVALLVNLGGVLVGGTWWLLGRGELEVVGASGPWWWLLAGGAGWLVLAGLAAASSRLGVAAALAVVVAAQVVGGVVVDARDGLAPLDLRALAGGLLVVAGVWLLATRSG